MPKAVLDSSAPFNQLRDDSKTSTTYHTGRFVSSEPDILCVHGNSWPNREHPRVQPALALHLFHVVSALRLSSPFVTRLS